MITIEKFDPKKFRGEKESFRLGLSRTFNVSEGYGEEDGVRPSYLWRFGRSHDEFRRCLWAEIQEYLPRYLAGELPTIGGEPKWYNGSYFRHLMLIVELASTDDIKLLYISDRPHAELIKRCVEWLIAQI